MTLTWQIDGQWRYDHDLVTTIEVTFNPAESGGTRVTLEHRDLEAFGPAAEKMRDVFDSPGAWTSTLDAFAAAARS